jgi:Spy/CpxP family protein refolding chaperone
MRFKLWIGLILVFALGVLAGSVGTGFYYKKRVEQLAKYGPSKKAHLLTRRLAEELNLTEKQRADIEDILEDFHMRLSEVRRNVRPEIDKLREKTSDAIQETLNDDQREAFEEIRKRLKRWRPADRLRYELKRTDPERLMLQLKDSLNLTDEQASKVRPIMEKSIKGKRDILNQTRGQTRRDKRSLRRLLREHNMALEEELSQVLTAEQLVGFRRWQEEQRRKDQTLGKRK